MKDIMFRGLPIGEKEFIYGYYVFCRGHHYILQKYNENGYDERWEASGWIEVHPETVGQYVGSKDKNGKCIYKDDILGWEYFCDNENVKQHSVIKWDDSDGMYDFGDDRRPSFCQREIVGDIHHNKELLEGVGI